MTIKIRFHGDKAIIRWKHPGEAAFLKQQMTMFRDSMNGKMPISVKDEKGQEVPKMLLPRPQQPPVVIPGSEVKPPVQQPIAIAQPVKEGEPVIKAATVIPTEMYLRSGEPIPQISENPTVVTIDKAEP